MFGFLINIERIGRLRLHAIRQLKRFIADWELKNAAKGSIQTSNKKSPDRDAKRIAIVGAGPAGLTAAHCLAQKDYSVTVFEKLPIAGGMMAVGIPAFRLPREILRAEINAIEAMGVAIKTGVAFGKDITLEGLKSQGYQAVFLATGLHGSRKLGVVGEDLPGVVDGVSFLRDIALGNPVTLGSKVVVVGGGLWLVDTFFPPDPDTLLMVESQQVEDAVDHYEAYFPGHNPIPMNKVVNGYVKSVLGKATGEIIRMYDNC